MTDYYIVKDTIELYDSGAPVYSVSALVTETTRESGQYVNVMWNSSTGTTVLQNLLISAYEALFTNPTAVLKGQIREAIGTVIEPVIPDPPETTVTITAASVTVNEVPP